MCLSFITFYYIFIKCKIVTRTLKTKVKRIFLGQNFFTGKFQSLAYNLSFVNFLSEKEGTEK